MRRAFYLLKRRYRAVLGEIPTYPVPTWPLAAEWIPTYPVPMYMMIPTRLDTQILAEKKEYTEFFSDL